MNKRLLPAFPFLRIPDQGSPYQEGYQCSVRETTFLGARNTCSKCGSRDQMRPVRLPNTGKLYIYSIVFRSFSGIEVPYINAIDDLDDGTSIKSNLINIEPDPAQIAFDMPVEVLYENALGRTDSDGSEYLAYFFPPASL